MLTGKDLITALRARGQSDQLAQWAADALDTAVATEAAVEAPTPTPTPMPRPPAKKAAAKRVKPGKRE